MRIKKQSNSAEHKYSSPVQTKEKVSKSLTVMLHYSGKCSTFAIDCSNKTCGDLFQILKDHVKQTEAQSISPRVVTEGGTGSIETDPPRQDPNKITQFITIQKNIPFDYYLSLPKCTLSVFQGITLQLQPYYSQQCLKKVNLRDFTLLKCIGVGGFSRVYLVRKKDTGKFYALKLIDKKFIMENQKEIIVQNERDIMANIENDFVTPLHFAFETKYYIAFVLEYCAGGELFYHLRKLRRLSEADAKFYFVEICIGMSYLHSKGIVYRDIKPENILLDLNGHLLLSDFGLSKPNMSPDNYAYSFCGSPEYMAPEMLLKSGHNFMVDCYCLGALLYELVTGLPPFYSHNTQEIYNSILSENIKFPPYISISLQLKDLIQKLLQKDPLDRLGKEGGVIQILSHPWFKDVDFKAMLQKKIKAPYSPEPLKYNFDEEEFNKGDTEFRKQFQANLQKESIEQPNQVLKNFYYSRELIYTPVSQQQLQSNQNTNKHRQKMSYERVSPPSKPIATQFFSSVERSESRENNKQPQRVNKIGKSEIIDIMLNLQSPTLISKPSGHNYSKTVQGIHAQLYGIKSQKQQDPMKQSLIKQQDLTNMERTQTIPDINLGELRIKSEAAVIHSQNLNSKQNKGGQTSSFLKNEIKKLSVLLEKSKSTQNYINKKFSIQKQDPIKQSFLQSMQNNQISIDRTQTIPDLNFISVGEIRMKSEANLMSAFNLNTPKGSSTGSFLKSDLKNFPIFTDKSKSTQNQTKKKFF